MSYYEAITENIFHQDAPFKKLTTRLNGMQMKEMNFPDTFIEWIMECISIVSYRYSVNGHNSELLRAKRGLRKGNPMFPPLFMLVMEYLHRSLTRLQHIQNFNLHPRCEKLGITNIKFADDLIMFTRGDTISVKE